jgi:hypothetical protein
VKLSCLIGHPRDADDRPGQVGDQNRGPEKTSPLSPTARCHCATCGATVACSCSFWGERARRSRMGKALSRSGPKEKRRTSPPADLLGQMKAVAPMLADGDETLAPSAVGCRFPGGAEDRVFAWIVRYRMKPVKTAVACRVPKRRRGGNADTARAERPRGSISRVVRGTCSPCKRQLRPQPPDLVRRLVIPENVTHLLYASAHLLDCL